MEPLPFTIDQLVTQIREDLDEAVNTGTNLWDDAFLITRLNRGFREVWQTIRETKENWFLRTLKSTDPPLTIYGRTYDPAVLRLSASVQELILPPDYFEARSFTPALLSDGTDPGLRFHFSNLGTEEFRELRRKTGAALGTYLVDIAWREGGPRLVFAPTLGLDAATDVALEYVYQPKEYGAGDLLENSGFNRAMVDAAMAYTVLEAREKENASTATVQRAEQKYARKLALVTRSAGPRQTQDAEVVIGDMEELI